MSESEERNSQAFPQPYHVQLNDSLNGNQGDISCVIGMTKRELIASIALQGIVPLFANQPLHPDTCARYAVSIAEALIKELERTK